MFRDEANLLFHDNLGVLFDLCQTLDLQALIAAPEVARAEGNATYRRVRRVDADGAKRCSSEDEERGLRGDLGKRQHTPSVIGTALTWQPRVTDALSWTRTKPLLSFLGHGPRGAATRLAWSRSARKSLRSRSTQLNFSTARCGLACRVVSHGRSLMLPPALLDSGVIFLAVVETRPAPSPQCSVGFLLPAL